METFWDKLKVAISVRFMSFIIFGIAAILSLIDPYMTNILVHDRLTRAFEDDPTMNKKVW